MKQIANLLRLNIKPLLLALFLVAPMFIVEAKKQKYDNGNYYVGGWSKGMPNGEGTMTYSDGVYYTGNWEAGVRSGSGKMAHKNGDVYEGNWSRDQRSGSGKMFYKNGDVYEGNWSRNQKSGSGKILYKNGDVCEGDWINDAIDKGIMKYNNGDVYSGDWVSNMRQGMGTMTYSNGGVYNGSWIGGGRNKGTMQYANGDKYDGWWRNDKKEGTGTMQYANGDKYEGVWSDDIFKQGYYYKSGKLHQDGEWQSGKLCNGDEIIYINAPSNIKRVAKRYKKWGFVNTVIYYTNGNEYIGDIKGVLRDGEGTYSANVLEISGKWSDDILKSGTGKFTYNGIHNLTIFPTSNKEMVSVEVLVDSEYNIKVDCSSKNLQWGDMLTSQIDVKREEIKRIEEEMMIAEELKKKEEERAEELKKEAKIRAEMEDDIKNAWNYIWKDTDIDRLKKSNMAKLDAVLKWRNAIISGVVRDVRKFSEMKEAYKLGYAGGGYKKVDYYIIQLDGVAVRCDSFAAISNFSVGERIYAIGRYNGDTFFSDEYPLFISNTVYSSIKEIADYFARSANNNPKYANEYRFSKYCKNIYR